MRRASITAIACILAAPVSLAREPVRAPRVPAAPEHALGEQVRGTVMNVDVEKKSFTIVVEDKEVSLSYDAKTVFLLDGKEVDAARLLQIGTRVEIAREGDLARKVEVRTKKTH